MGARRTFLLPFCWDLAPGMPHLCILTSKHGFPLSLWGPGMHSPERAAGVASVKQEKTNHLFTKSTVEVLTYPKTLSPRKSWPPVKLLLFWFSCKTTSLYTCQRAFCQILRHFCSLWCQLQSSLAGVSKPKDFSVDLILQNLLHWQFHKLWYGYKFYTIVTNGFVHWVGFRMIHVWLSITLNIK